MRQDSYELRLFDLDDEEVGRDVFLPTIPPIGARLSMPGPDGRIWEVVSFPQYDLPHPASQASKMADPIVVHLQVRPSNGIHCRRAATLEVLEDLGETG